MQKIAPQQTEQQLRDYLGSFAFHGDKVNQAVSSFSGGEKAHLVLAIIVWQRPNLLLLDEPTNHLDLDMRQALTEALIDYQGSLIVVSHDRHLLRNTVEEFYLVHNKQVEEFTGDLEDYQKWLNEINSTPKHNEKIINNNENTSNHRKEQKEKKLNCVNGVHHYEKKLPILNAKCKYINKNYKKLKCCFLIQCFIKQKIKQNSPHF